MTGNTLRIVLDVQPAGETLTGRASAPDGTTREFSDWLGLLAALQALLPSTSPAPDRQPP